MQKNIFNIFPASVSSANVQKILEGAVFVLESFVFEKQVHSTICTLDQQTFY